MKNYTVSDQNVPSCLFSPRDEICHMRNTFHPRHIERFNNAFICVFLHNIIQSRLNREIFLCSFQLGILNVLCDNPAFNITQQPQCTVFLVWSLYLCISFWFISCSVFVCFSKQLYTDHQILVCESAAHICLQKSERKKKSWRTQSSLAAPDSSGIKCHTRSLLSEKCDWRIEKIWNFQYKLVCISFPKMIAGCSAFPNKIKSLAEGNWVELSNFKKRHGVDGGRE